MNEITARFRMMRGAVLLSASTDEPAAYAQVIVSSLVPLVSHCGADAEACGLVGSRGNARPPGAARTENSACITAKIETAVFIFSATSQVTFCKWVAIEFFIANRCTVSLFYGVRPPH